MSEKVIERTEPEASSAQQPRSRISRRTLLAWAVGIACVAAAWGITQLIPSPTSHEAPFSVPVETGERGEGRAFIATVHEVVLADEISVSGWQQPGNWVVVNLEVEARLKEQGTLLGRAMLVVDGREYRASERPPESLLRVQLLTGIPQRGSLAFELPEDAGGAAVLQLAVNDDTRLDSVIELALDLDSLPREAHRQLLRTEWGDL